MVIVSTEVLNDAAISLFQLLDGARIKAGIFGGYAVDILGGERASDAINCCCAAQKEHLVQLLDGEGGFDVLPLDREDYVALLWSDQILIQLFPDDFPGAKYSLTAARILRFDVDGASSTGYLNVLDPVLIFRGKLQACATRSKQHDATELRWLESAYWSALRNQRVQFGLEYVGMAMRRYPELAGLFARIGVDVPAARAQTQRLDPELRRVMEPGGVQEGLLAPPGSGFGALGGREEPYAYS